jgi:hypothetical protein
MAAAFGKLIFLPDLNEYEMFIFVALTSLAGCLIGTYATPKVDTDILENFYRVTRPFGFWGEINKSIEIKSAEEVDRENKRDILSTFFAVPWMLLMCITPMLFMVRLWNGFFISLGLLTLLSIALYFSWFRHLSTEVKLEGKGGVEPDGSLNIDETRDEPTTIRK